MYLTVHLCFSVAGGNTVILLLCFYNIFSQYVKDLVPLAISCLPLADGERRCVGCEPVGLLPAS
jgi:hypothetical protein